MDSRISARGLVAALGVWRTSEPAYEALADAVRLLCLDGRLAARTQLPAERELAAALALSRTTVAAAYRSLRDSGHIRSQRGSGSVTEPLGGGEGMRRTIAPDDFALDLQQASPPAWPGLPGVIAEAATDAASLVARPGYDVVGRADLRAAIAANYSARGLPTVAEQIIVTTGAQSAIALLATVLVTRGDRVVFETPTYPHAAEAFRRAGGRLVGIPVSTGGGWDLDRAGQAFARTVPVAAYLMPDFQNPTGRSMTIVERDEIARAAVRAGTTVVVDDTTADLSVEPFDRAPLFGLDVPGLDIVRVGSLGKTVWGGLRIGWIRAETSLIRRLIAARFAAELGTPDLDQAIAARVMDRYDEVVAQRAHVLRAGRDTVVDGVASLLPEWSVPDVKGGVALWIDLGAPLSGNVVLAARARGMLLSPGPRFSVDGGHDTYLRVPFTATVDVLERAVGVLAQCWRDVRAMSPVMGMDRLDAVI